METTPVKYLPPGAKEALGGPPVIMPESAAKSDGIGHATFDGLPADLKRRRLLTDTARKSLQKLVSTIKAETETLGPVLDDLAPQADILLTAENFDHAAAVKFVSALGAVVSDLTAAPAKPVKAAPAAKAPDA